MTSVELPLPCDAYVGNEPFAFISYAHKDALHVFPEIMRLHSHEIRLWYDEGIDPGNEWPEEVANALARAAFFLVFITNNAVASTNVRNEINYALSKEKPFLAVHLEETELPPGLDLRMGSIQAVLKYRMSEDTYARKLLSAFPHTLRSNDIEDEAIMASYPRPISNLAAVIKRSISSIEIELDTTYFDQLTDRDRDPTGPMRACMFTWVPRVPTFEDKNSKSIWTVSFGGLQGQEIETLLHMLEKQGIDELTRCKALLLLQHSIHAHPESVILDNALPILSRQLDSSPIVQKAGLAVFEDISCDGSAIWKYVSNYIDVLVQERFAFLIRSIWKWVPIYEQSEFCNRIWKCFENTTSAITGCNCMYAIRKLEFRDILPAVRDLLPRTTSSWKAWYLARLAEDFQDHDAVPALREAFSRYKDETELAEILYSLGGDKLLPFICKTALQNASEMQDRVFESNQIPRERVLATLQNLARHGSSGDRMPARKAINRIVKKSQAPKAWWKFWQSKLVS